MNTRDGSQLKTDQIFAELRALHNEVDVLRRQVSISISLIGKMAAEIHSLKSDERHLRQSVEAMDAHLTNTHPIQAEPAIHCPECGAPLAHHAAPAGDLAICPVCGWSLFSDGVHPSHPHSIAGDSPRSGIPMGWADDISIR